MGIDGFEQDSWNSNASDLKSVCEYFQQDNFHASELVVNKNEINDSRDREDPLYPITYLSEAIRAGNDPLAPLRFRWYAARYALGGNADTA